MWGSIGRKDSIANCQLQVLGNHGMAPNHRCHSSFWWQLPICPSEQREHGWHLDCGSIQRAKRAKFKR